MEWEFVQKIAHVRRWIPERLERYLEGGNEREEVEKATPAHSLVHLRTRKVPMI